MDTTPRPPVPPTITALPRRDGLSRRSTGSKSTRSWAAGPTSTTLIRLRGAQNLLERFDEVNGPLTSPGLPDLAQLNAARESLRSAVTELQFHDMSTQLIAHMSSTLQACAFRLGAAAMGADEEDGGTVAIVPQLPDRPNPVTQSEMDAGSVELF